MRTRCGNLANRPQRLGPGLLLNLITNQPGAHCSYLEWRSGRRRDERGDAGGRARPERGIAREHRRRCEDAKNEPRGGVTRAGGRIAS